ncbi:MAG: double-strand break repair protein AddB, partial [Alphaproteobacteria bacterium]|nr:double-strand break repair protein AddB [Alphaproteobacteria bacterium]
MRIHSIPAGAPFADLLAQGLLAHFCPRPEDLADALVLLPTRRAARALHEAFLRASGGRPLLLPRMEPVGDVDDDELLLDQDLGSGLAPAIGAQRRLAALAQVLRAHPATGGDPATACRLAASLVSLLDSAALEEVPLARLESIVEADLAGHWQQSLRVLDILREAWPRHLAQLGLSDLAARRIAALRARIAAWAVAPPRGLVVAAGSTGSIPATADLLAAVAALPRGVLLLPGLDAAMDDESWHAAGEDPA